MHKIVFVTGKGGVGKSTVATFLAAREASLGKKVLLVEMGPWSFLSLWLGFQSTDLYVPTPTPYGFDWSMWTGEDCLKEYVGYLVKLPWLSRAFFENNWMKALIKVAPGLREISFLGKITSQLRDHGPKLHYDTIVVDAMSSGHFVSLLQAPHGLKNMTKTGPIREQCESIEKALNSSSVQTLVVTTPESFAIQETKELVASMKHLMTSPIHVVINKMQDIPEVHGPIRGGGVLQELASLRLLYQENRQKILQDFPLSLEIPFYFSALKNILQDQNELQRLFAKL